MICNSTSEYLHECIESRESGRHLHTHAHSNNPNVHPLGKWTNHVCSIHTVEYYSAFKKEGNSDACYYMDEP